MNNFISFNSIPINQNVVTNISASFNSLKKNLEVKQTKVAENLPLINQNYPLKNLNRVAVTVNTQLATDYQRRGTNSDPKDAA